MVDEDAEKKQQRRRYLIETLGSRNAAPLTKLTIKVFFQFFLHLLPMNLESCLGMSCGCPFEFSHN